MPRGALRLADTGYFDLSRLGTLSKQGVYRLSRVPSHLTVREADGPERHLAEFLEGTGAGRVDRLVTLGAERLEARLLAMHLPKDATDTRKRRLKKENQRRGKPCRGNVWPFAGG